MPKSRAAHLAEPSSSSHWAPAPLAPVKFSGLMERETLPESRVRFPMWLVIP